MKISIDTTVDVVNGRPFIKVLDITTDTLVTSDDKIMYRDHCGYRSLFINDEIILSIGRAYSVAKYDEIIRKLEDKECSINVGPW